MHAALSIAITNSRVLTARETHSSFTLRCPLGGKVGGAGLQRSGRRVQNSRERRSAAQRLLLLAGRMKHFSFLGVWLMKTVVKARGSAGSMSEMQWGLEGSSLSLPLYFSYATFTWWRSQEKAEGENLC